MITWVVETDRTSVRRAEWNKQISLACSAFGDRYHEIKIIPFSHDVVGGDPVIEGSVIAYGSTAIFDVVKRNNWNPGIFKIGTESDLLSRIGEDYLNHDMRVLDASDIKHFVTESNFDFFFIKPDTDTKSFDGTIVDSNRLDFFLEQHQQKSGYDFNTKICVSPVKDIEKEWRLFVVDGRVVTWSLYQEKRKYRTARSIEPAALKFAQLIVEKYNPARAFVIDVAKIDGTYKVVEYNTFNHSGFYDCDILAITKAFRK